MCPCEKSYTKKQIRIGDILLMAEKKACEDKSLSEGEKTEVWVRYRNSICKYFRLCGINNSIQEIIEASGWVYECQMCGLKRNCTHCTLCDCFTDEQLKDPNARALIEGINKLFPETP